MKYIIYIWYIFLCTWNIVHQFWVSSLKIIFDHSFLSINNQFFWHNFVLLQVRQRCYFSISGSGYGFQFLMAALQTTTTVFIPLQYHTMICTYICLTVLMHPPREFSVFRCHRLKHEAKCTPQLPWRVAHEPQSRPLALWNRKMVKPLSRIGLLLCVVMSRMVTMWFVDIFVRSAPKLHLGELPSNSLEQQYSSSNWSCYNTCLNKKCKKRLCRSSGIVWTLKLRHCWMVESFVASCNADHTIT